MSHEISNRAFEKMARLYFLVKDIEAPIVYEEDGFYSTYACCHRNEDQGHSETCIYSLLEKQTEKLAYIFEPLRRKN